MRSPRYAYLVNTLRLVASPPAVQMSFYPHGVAVTDEIALDYSDAMLQVPEVSEDNGFSLSLTKALKEIDSRFTEMSSHPECGFWSEEALFQDDRWESIRSKALATLKIMNEEYEPPLSDRSVFIF